MSRTQIACALLLGVSCTLVACVHSELLQLLVIASLVFATIVALLIGVSGGFG